MIENVRPTRMELLNTKQKLVLAEKGHKLLKQKRDVLVMEFFGLVKKAKNLRGELNSQMQKSFQSLAITEAFHGELFVRANAMAVKKAPLIDVTAKNIMRVKIPVVEGVNVTKTLLERGYSIQGTSAKFDDSAENFEKSLQIILQLAESETAIKRLLKEIEKTNRRVNALEFNIQPKMKETIKEIAAHLNRLESERFFALKITKKRLEKKE